MAYSPKAKFAPLLSFEEALRLNPLFERPYPTVELVDFSFNPIFRLVSQNFTI